MSIVDEYVKTFFERNPTNKQVNDLVYKSIIPAADNNHILHTADAVYHLAKSRYSDRQAVLDTLWGATKIEALSIEDHNLAVLTLASLKSVENRPVKFLTLDSYLIKYCTEKPTSKFEHISPEKALELV